MSDSIYSFNSKLLPVPSITVDATPVLQLADPVLYNLATFFSQLLQTNLLPRFQEECAACGVTNANMSFLQDGYAVAQTVVFPLYPHILRTTAFQFPLLSIFPEKEAFDQLTLNYLATRRTMVVSWILPPLTPQQYNRLYPFLGLASKTWLAYGVQGYDPKVSPNGPSFWQQANLSFGIMQGVDYKPYPGASQIKGSNNFQEAYFPSIQLRFQIEEKDQAPVPQNYTTFTGVNLLQVEQVDGYNISQPFLIADGYVEPDITISSVTPNFGTINGETLLVIQGTGFDPDKFISDLQIVIAGVPVKNFWVKSPTVILCVTNPNSASTGPVQILDRAGNTYNGPNFTYQ